MADELRVLAEYGYLVLFVVVFMEQFGLPLPTVPFALAAGALCASSHLDLGVVIAGTVAVSLPGDWVWYELGRRRGLQVLRFLCRVSLEPDSCVRRTRGFFDAGGAPALIVSKFVPGFSTAAPPMAGIAKMPRPRFLMYAVMSSLLWISAWSALGYALHDQLEWVARGAASLGAWALWIALAAIALYVAFRFVQRHRFLRALRVARIEPEELYERQQRGEPVVVVDLRQASDLELEALRIPGSLLIPLEEIESRAHEIPQDQEIVLYCT